MDQEQFYLIMFKRKNEDFRMNNGLFVVESKSDVVQYMENENYIVYTFPQLVKITKVDINLT
jgi:hypothetical protein